ncbi:MAG: hypothetical protein AAF081_08480 [Actinomycetota bacterium]
MAPDPEPSLADDETQLAAFALDLAHRVDGALDAWVRRSLTIAAAAGGVTVDDSALPAVVDATRAAVMPDLRRVLAADVDAGAGSPLAALRGAVGPMTELLDRWGAARPPRDEFLERQFPGDPYHLGPAAFSDVHEDLHEPGLVWGAARAHVHLRRRREAEDG